MLKVFLIIAIFAISLQINAQFRHGSCKSKSQSRLYVTPYIGMGIGSYSFDLNGTAVGPAPDSTNYEEAKGSMFTPVIGVNLMYSIGSANIGGGVEWQGLYGTASTDIGSYKQDVFLYKFYAKFEYALYSDPFNDFGFHLQAGLLFPNNVVGHSANMGGFGGGGLFYNLILNSKSSLLFSADYEFVMFTSTIGNSVSNHTFNPIKLSVGYRFWF